MRTAARRISVSTTPFFDLCDSAAERLGDAIAGHKAVFLALFTAVYVIGAGNMAARQMLWLDEIITVYISGLPRAADIWPALARAADGNPPLFHLITRWSTSLFGGSSLALRLPELLGVWLMSVCLFLFVSRRASAPAGAVAAVIPALTEIYVYGYEARPYGLVLGLFGVALVSWQAAGEGRGRRLALAGLTVSLAAAVCCHYFAAFLWIPIACGELMRSRERRSVDPAIWISLALAAAPIWALRPLMRAIADFTFEVGRDPRYWAAPSLWNLMNAYANLLHSLIIPAVAAAAVLTVLWMLEPRRKPMERPGLPVPEVTAAVVLLLLPFLTFGVARITHGGFTLRYILPAGAGCAILAGFLSDFLLARRAVFGMALLAVLSGFLCLFTAYHVISTKPGTPFQENKLLVDGRFGDLPVVVAEGLAYAQFAYYAPPALRSRLFFLTDDSALGRYADPTNELLLRSMKGWNILNVMELERFAGEHSRFFLYYTGGSPEAALADLLARGFNARVRAKSGNQLMLLVERGS